MTSEYKSLLEEFYGNQDSKPGPETPEDRQRRWSREAMRRLYAKRRKLGLNAHGKPFAIRRRNFNKQTKPQEKPRYAQNSFA